jgi:AraC family transcriptional regulator, positive regulator of tynA and feaB
LLFREGTAGIEILTFRTGRLPPHERLRRWNEMSGAATTPLVADPLDKLRFRASLEHAGLGPLKISEIRSTASTVRHSLQHAAMVREPQFLIGLQLKGACAFSQVGAQTLLRPGDFALFDSTLPFDVVTSGAHALLVLGFPHELLKRYVPCPEAVLGRRMPGHGGLSALVSTFIRGFWSGHRSGLDRMLLPRISSAILDLVGGVYAPFQNSGPASAPSAVWRVRIRDYIEAHLQEADLTPARIASALRISKRYLHRLFNEGEETVRSYIQGRRLEECAAAFGASEQRGRTITEIALSYGFNNPSHFSRVFRARYKVTPRGYRAMAGSGSACI